MTTTKVRVTRTAPACVALRQVWQSRRHSAARTYSLPILDHCAFFCRPRNRHLTWRARRVHVLPERPSDPDLDRIEELRLDTVRAVIAQLDAPEHVRRRDMKFEQQFAGLRLPRGAFGEFGENQRCSSAIIISLRRPVPFHT